MPSHRGFVKRRGHGSGPWAFPGQSVLAFNQMSGDQFNAGLENSIRALDSSCWRRTGSLGILETPGVQKLLHKENRKHPSWF
jgi:hypothetical protein